MTARRQWAVVAGIVVVLGAGLWLAATQLGTELFPLKIGSKAPDFAAVTLPRTWLDVEPVRAATPPIGEPATKGIDDYRGEVVLLNIWATWCAPCRVEMPSMEKLERQLGPKGLRIVAVSIDIAGAEPTIASFAREHALSFEILHDAPGAIQAKYQTTGVPETFIIDRAGRIRKRVIGPDDWASPANVAFLERLLAEPASR